MSSDAMSAKVAAGRGFVAALDQSGGSTPDALRQYGVQDDAYHDEAGMLDAMHAMRVRVMTAPAFTGDKVLGSILFEHTMDRQIGGQPIPAFLWEQRRVVPFLKIDKGREEEKDGVKLMKPIPGLDTLLDRAARLGVFGTKMRSVISQPSAAGIAAVVAQQFEVAGRIVAHGLVPIIEPEVLIDSQDRAGSEHLLLTELRRHLDALPDGRDVMLKLSIPAVPDLYLPLADHPRVACLLALSGGFDQDEACARLAANHGMIGSFSRALLQDLRVSQSDEAFNGTLAAAIDRIFQASTVKH